MGRYSIVKSRKAFCSVLAVFISSRCLSTQVLRELLISYFSILGAARLTFSSMKPMNDSDIVVWVFSSGNRRDRSIEESTICVGGLVFSTFLYEFTIVNVFCVDFRPKFLNFFKSDLVFCFGFF